MEKWNEPYGPVVPVDGWTAFAGALVKKIEDIIVCIEEDDLQGFECTFWEGGERQQRVYLPQLSRAIRYSEDRIDERLIGRKL